MNAMSRRDLLKTLGLASGAALTSGCTPMKILMHWYPPDFDRDRELVDRNLVAFADAVLGDAVDENHFAARPFHDERFPLHKYRGFLASDLCGRASDLYGTDRFDLLRRQDRCAVISNGLAGDATTRKLYSGAIYLTQVACYAGIYDDESGCPAIEFEGKYRRRPFAELTYPDPESFLAEEVGIAGNYA